MVRDSCETPPRLQGTDGACSIGGPRRSGSNEVVAERIRAEIAALTVPEIPEPAGITVSAGVAERTFWEAISGFAGRGGAVSGGG